jgi:GntR family transcriptional regulator/MocR family aminotransferase
MPLDRRHELLRYASEAGVWIVEDDYDSEFRYTGQPLPALQGIDDSARVIYVGTFSKVILPGLRLGYLVIPPDLIDVFRAARFVEGVHASQMDQAVVADFIGEGHFGRHIRRMRELYGQRQQVLVDAIRRFGGEIQAAEGGMQAILRLPSGLSDREAASRAARAGVHTTPMSTFFMGAPTMNALLLGFAAFRPPQIVRGARTLMRAIDP